MLCPVEVELNDGNYGRKFFAMFPFHVEVEEGGAEEAVGVVCLVSWTRVLTQHVFDELLLMFFQGCGVSF